MRYNEGKHTEAKKSGLDSLINEFRSVRKSRHEPHHIEALKKILLLK